MGRALDSIDMYGGDSDTLTGSFYLRKALSLLKRKNSMSAAEKHAFVKAGIRNPAVKRSRVQKEVIHDDTVAQIRKKEASPERSEAGE